jgi:hypothetical protein
MVGTYGEVQGITRPQAKPVLVSEAGSRAELYARNGENGETIGTQPREHRQHIGAVDLSSCPVCGLMEAPTRPLLSPGR